MKRIAVALASLLLFSGGVVAAAMHLVRAPAVPLVSEDLVDRLDAICQARFENVSTPVFGMSRIVDIDIPTVTTFTAATVKPASMWQRCKEWTEQHLALVVARCRHPWASDAPTPQGVALVIGRHPSIGAMVPQTPAEQSAVRALERRQRAALLYVAGRRSDGWVTLTTTRTVVNGRGPWKTAANSMVLTGPALLTRSPATAPVPEAEIRGQLDSLYRDACAGKNVHFTTADWQIVARPVRAGSARCVSCHASTTGGKPLKVGDPIGVAFYAFARTAP